MRLGYALALIYLAGTFVYSAFGLKDIKLPAAREHTVVDAQEQAGVKPFEYYIEGVSGKELFGAARGSFDQGIQSAAAGVNVADDLNLVGIISGANPQAIIEEKKSNKTYYLSRGQLIGDLRIDDIQEGRIVVERRGQKFELYL
jgi:type II secretory pathway component PulC